MNTSTTNKKPAKTTVQRIEFLRDVECDHVPLRDDGSKPFVATVPFGFTRDTKGLSVSYQAGGKVTIHLPTVDLANVPDSAVRVWV